MLHGHVSFIAKPWERSRCLGRKVTGFWLRITVVRIGVLVERLRWIGCGFSCYAVIRISLLKLGSEFHLCYVQRWATPVRKCDRSWWLIMCKAVYVGLWLLVATMSWGDPWPSKESRWRYQGWWWSTLCGDLSWWLLGSYRDTTTHCALWFSTFGLDTSHITAYAACWLLRWLPWTFAG